MCSIINPSLHKIEEENRAGTTFSYVFLFPVAKKNNYKLKESNYVQCFYKVVKSNICNDDEDICVEV